MSSIYYTDMRKIKLKKLLTDKNI